VEAKKDGSVRNESWTT